MITGLEIPDDDIARVGLLDRASVPWHVALGAQAEDTFVHNPITQAYSAMELYMASNPMARQGFGNPADAPIPFNQEIAQQRDSDGSDAFVDSKTLNEQYGQSLGLTFDQPTRKGAVSILVRRKQEEIARQASIQRAPGGFGYGLASLATQLAVSATDPLNVASAFIPVVGEARAAIWAEKYGRTAARFATGGIEGAVGAAAVEPLNYGASKYLGDDYTMGDSLMNIALGTVLGGGLHVGFGAFTDHLSRLAPETREAALRGAVANTAEGRPVDVAHIIGTDPTYRQFDQMPVIHDLTLQADEARLQAQHDALGAQVAKLPAGDPTAHDALTRLKTVEDQLKSDVLDPALRRQLSTRRDEILTDTTPEKLQAAAQPIEQRRQMQTQQDRLREEIGFVKQKRTALATQSALTPPSITSAADSAARRFREASAVTPPDRVAQDAARQEGNATLSTAADEETTNAIDRARTASVEYGRGKEPSTATITPEASANADRAVREARGDDIDAEHAEALAQIDAFEKQGALTPAEAEAGRAGAEDIKQANQRSKAAKAAANCLLLHP